MFNAKHSREKALDKSPEGKDIIKQRKKLEELVNKAVAVGAFSVICEEPILPFNVSFLQDFGYTIDGNKISW